MISLPLYNQNDKLDKHLENYSTLKVDVAKVSATISLTL